MNSKIVLLLVTASGDDHQMNASAVACCMLLKCKGITWLSSCFHLTVKTQKGLNNDVVFNLPKTRCEVQIKYACLKKKANAILKDSCVFYFCFQYVLQQ